MLLRSLLPVLALGLVACETKSPQTRLSAQTYGDTYAAVSPDARVFLSSGSADRLGMCAVAASETCGPSHATYQVASKVFEKGGRKILAFANAPTLAPEMTYVVVTEASQVEARFRLIDGSVDPLAGGLAGIRSETLKEELSYVTRDELNGRLAATPENAQIADWLIAHLKAIGIGPGNKGDYRQKFRLGVGPTAAQETANVVGLIEGSDPQLKNEYIIIGAHMDHAGTLARGYTCSQGSIAGDKICNGADDNGSGTIAVLNVAKALAAAKGQLKRSVLIMWFSGEEEGLIGSKYYVARPIVPLEQTVYMVNMDMVGYMKSFDNALAALGGGSSRAGKEILQDVAKKYPSNRIEISERAGGGSDHAPFMAAGIPGVFFHTGVENNPHYHRTSDHADKIDFDGMTMATKVAFETTFRMANSASGGTYGGERREALVTAEELAMSCHHLIKNPFLKEVSGALDFTNGN